tara:strand:+ start:30 stop:416 length:387 start_codon:yes stop_codon:yes gene_type:complete
MSNYKINHKRNRFKSNGDRNFRRRNGNGQKINSEFNNGLDFRRRNPGKNNQNAARLIDKYNDLAREALSNGDKILSENYLQHADHFSRILQSRELSKQQNSISPNTESTTSEDNIHNENDGEKNSSPE